MTPNPIQFVQEYLRFQDQFHSTDTTTAPNSAPINSNDLIDVLLCYTIEKLTNIKYKIRNEIQTEIYKEIYLVTKRIVDIIKHPITPVYSCLRVSDDLAQLFRTHKNQFTTDVTNNMRDLFSGLCKLKTRIGAV